MVNPFIKRAVDELRGKRVAYSPPYNPDVLAGKYPQLANCPIHTWRASTGVELVHKEPDVKELQRIYRNWQRMPDDLKAVSDARSIELFGKTNEEHYQELLSQYGTRLGNKVP